MSTSATGPLEDVLIGHPWRYLLTWNNPDGSPVDLTGMTIKADFLATSGKAVPDPTVTTRNDKAGQIQLDASEDITSKVQVGVLNMLKVTYTDLQGQDHVYTCRIRGYTAGNNPQPPLPTDTVFTAVSKQGPAGPAGPAGPSVYDLYVAGGGVLSEADWIASLGGGGDAPQLIQLKGASSQTVTHGKPYPPKVTVLDADGAECETDVLHSSGQVTVVFPFPFTGTLYVG